MKDHLLAIFQSAVDAADPFCAVERSVSVDGNYLISNEGRRVRINLPQPGKGRILVVGAGKGTAPMAQAVEGLLGDRIDGGVVCVKDGHGCKLDRIKVMQASHPLPDDRGVAAAREILDLVSGAGEDDLIISLLSGGGSALLTLPAEGVELGQLQQLTELLLASGAEISEINTVRKHLSKVKGGRLAAAASPASVLNLVLSDVVGDRLDVIASGPFTPDPTTYSDAKAILQRFGVWEKVAENIRGVILAGERGDFADTPKPGEGEFEKIQHSIIGSNRVSIEAAAETARELGYSPLVLTSLLEGEAREAARFLAAVAKECALTGSPVAPPVCLLAGGETTVTIKGKGLGGRNQELALALSIELDGWEGIAGFSGGTDGTDGPTDAAGAVATWSTASRAKQLGLNADEYLTDNDSYHFFDHLGDLVKTGPTRTNVMDVQILLVSAG